MKNYEKREFITKVWLKLSENVVFFLQRQKKNIWISLKLLHRRLSLK